VSSVKRSLVARENIINIKGIRKAQRKSGCGVS
jgi:hypothetical protein